MDFDERLVVSGDVEEPPECLADDLARGGVIRGGASFDGGTELRVDAHGDDLGRARSHWRSSAARTELGDVVAGLGLGLGLGLGDYPLDEAYYTTSLSTTLDINDADAGRVRSWCRHRREPEPVHGV